LRLALPVSSHFFPTSIHGPTAGLFPVIVLATATSWLTTRALRSDGLPLSMLGLGAGQRKTARFVHGLMAGAILAGLWMVIVTVATGASWRSNPTLI
jgi:hypothetical protein